MEKLGEVDIFSTKRIITRGKINSPPIPRPIFIRKSDPKIPSQPSLDQLRDTEHYKDNVQPTVISELLSLEADENSWEGKSHIKGIITTKDPAFHDVPHLQQERGIAGVVYAEGIVTVLRSQARHLDFSACDISYYDGRSIVPNRFIDYAEGVVPELVVQSITVDLDRYPYDPD